MNASTSPAMERLLALEPQCAAPPAAAPEMRPLPATSQPSTAALHVQSIRSERQFDALEADWRALAARCPQSSLFLAWDWQRLWWRYYGAQRQLCILVARQAGQVVGILPLYRETHRVARLIKVRKLRPLGAGGDTAPDDLGLLAPPAQERAVAAACIDYVLRHVSGWQLIDLVDLPLDGALARRLLDHAAQHPARVHITPPQSRTCGELPADWPGYLRSLSSNRRELIGRKRRKFEKLPGARFRRIDDVAQLDAAFDRLALLHRQRWQQRSDDHGFSSPAYLGFHRALMHALLAQGQLRLYALDLDGQAVAMFYGFRQGDALCYFQAGFDPAHAALSPGEVLMAYVIEAAIAEGCTVFDMLKGDYAHKRHFFQQTRQTLDIRLYRPGLIHLLYRLQHWLQRRRAGVGGQAAADAATEPAA